VHLRLVSFVLVLLVAPATARADNARNAFVRSWEGRTVTIGQPLYTLIDNERGKLGSARNGRREGLTVLTPSNGVYFQFDGRQGKDDIVTPAPHGMLAAVDEAYGPDALDVRSYRKIEALAVHQCSPGAKLIVGRIRIDRDSVKVGFVQPGSDLDDEPVTSITIRWPLPLSKAFTEGDNIDALLRTWLEPDSTL
jgi:hypothetical protein